MQAKTPFRITEILLGILFIFLAIYTLTHPLRGAGFLVILYAISAIVTGIFDIFAYVNMKKNGTATGGELSIVSAILTLIVGIILVFSPGTGVWVLTFLFPIWFILHAVMRLSTISLIKESGGKGLYWFTLIINVICIILGVLMLFDPAASFITFTYLVAFYLFLAGFSSIGLGIAGIKPKQ